MSQLPRFVEIMQRLLAPDGCPWDREQTPESLRRYVIEEAHEVVEAIDARDPHAIREELGDLLMQIVFISEIARARAWFDLDDVIVAISDKMVRRHPHVFGDAVAASSADVLARWERDKELEHARKGTRRGVLDGVPVAMPALLRALKISEKAARVGFDWPDAAGARAKVDEELRELDEASESGDLARTEAELGDVLFALVSWSRKRGIDPEAALRGTIDRFTRRFQEVERRADAEGEALTAMSDEELDRRWRAAKREVG